MDKDFKELLSLFNAHSVRYLIVGGYAYSRYAEPRSTKDLDLFLKPDHANAEAIFRGLTEFGAPLKEISIEDFTNPEMVFQIGVAPLRIDLLLKIDGLSFEQAWSTSEEAFVDGIPVRYISLEALIVNKLAAGRPQDHVDVQMLHKAQSHIAPTKD